MQPIPDGFLKHFLPPVVISLPCRWSKNDAPRRTQFMMEKGKPMFSNLNSHRSQNRRFHMHRQHRSLFIVLLLCILGFGVLPAALAQEETAIPVVAYISQP